MRRLLSNALALFALVPGAAMSQDSQAPPDSEDAPPTATAPVVAPAPVPAPVPVVATPAPAPAPAAAPALARFNVQTSDPDTLGARVFVDGLEHGTIPLEFELAPGRHQVEIKRDGFVSFSRWYTVDVGARRDIEVILKRAEAPTPVAATVETPADEKASSEAIPTVVEPKKQQGKKKGAPLGSDSTRIKAVAAIGGFAGLKLTGEINGVEFEGREKVELDRNDFGVGVQFTSAVNPVFAVGALFQTWVNDSDDGMDRDTTIDAGPLVALRIPIGGAERTHVELYAQGGGGVTMNLLSDVNKDRIEADGTNIGDVGIGWHVQAAAGVQFNLLPNLGLFAEGGWQMHEVHT